MTLGETTFCVCIMVAMLCVDRIGLPCSSSRKANRRWTNGTAGVALRGESHVHIHTTLCYGLSMYWLCNEWATFAYLMYIFYYHSYIPTQAFAMSVVGRMPFFTLYIIHAYIHININMMCVCVYSGRDAIKMVSPEAIVFSLLCWFVAVSFIFPSFCPHFIHARMLLQFYLFSSTSARARCICGMCQAYSWF